MSKPGGVWVNKYCHVGITRDRWIALQILGCKCAHCHNTDYMVLEIDHIVSTGASAAGKLKKHYTGGTRRGYGGGSHNVNAVIKLGSKAREVFQCLCPTCHVRKTKLSGDCRKNKEYELVELFNDQFDMFAEQVQSTEVLPNGNGQGYPPVRVSPVVRVRECEVTINYRQQDLALSSPDNQAPETPSGDIEGR